MLVTALPQAELREIKRAVTGGTREAGRGLKAELRRQVPLDGRGLLGMPLSELTELTKVRMAIVQPNRQD